MSDIVIRDATDADWPRIWPIIQEVVRAGDTFAYDPAMTEEQARQIWMQTRAPSRTVVAVDGERVLGTANMYPNRPGPGSHISSASFMVSADARGRGLGRTLVVDMIDWARSGGFAAVQFNAVVDTNTSAIRLYEDLGFRTIGVAPGAFRHPSAGDVDLRIMWLDLHAR